ncbi:hypothetical protein [Methanobrevibacter sp.]|uniref:hypothetical protein n=1 Tax=Methanobrevibacter sp. TaxID=66852 RepID=UPI003890871D
MCEQMWIWNNLPIVLTNHAWDKSADIGLSMWDIIQLLDSASWRFKRSIFMSKR